MTRIPRLALVAAALTAALAPATSHAGTFPQYCMYPYDGAICTPTPRDVLSHVPQYCMYPTDFALCIPPNVWIPPIG